MQVVVRILTIKRAPYQAHWLAFQGSSAVRYDEYGEEKQGKGRATDGKRTVMEGKRLGREDMAQNAWIYYIRIHRISTSGQIFL